MGPDAPAAVRSLRILYHHRTAASDGMRVHVTAVIEALRREGHDVCVVGPGDASAAVLGRAARLERLSDALRRLLPGAAYELLELIYNIPAYLRLRRAAKAFAPDVLYERYNLYLLAGLAYRRRHGLPMILEVNAPLAEERAKFGNLRLEKTGRRCEAALWRRADAVLPVTEVLAGAVRAARGTGDGVLVVPNGADLELKPDPAAAAAARRRLGLSDDAMVLGFVGFVRGWHGVGWAIEALQRAAPNVHLVVVGDGPARPELEAQAMELGVADRVRFTGRVAHDEAPMLAQAFDVALQPAAVAYASPLKLFEYMQLGRAILAPDQPNIREVLSHDENALLFDAADAGAFQAALARLCADADLRARLGAAARRTIAERPFTWAGNARRIAGLAQALANARSGAA